MYDHHGFLPHGGRTQKDPPHHRPLLEPDIPGVSQYEVKYHASVYDAGYKLGKENAGKIKALLGDEGE